MRNYNRMIVITVFIYLIGSILSAFWILETGSVRQNAYRIEINRIYSSLSEEETFDRLPLHSYEYVREISWISAEQQDETMVLDFYGEKNLYRHEIRPWYIDGNLKGYVRFDYILPETESEKTLFIVEGILFFMEGYILSVLFYLKYRLLRPFHRMSEIPHELASGHFKEDIIEEKNKYFGKFLWGLGQLKSELETTRQRELELEKEKKQMLLSLSHDIKTPLNAIKLYGRALEEGLYHQEEKKLHAAHQIGEKAEEIERYVEEIRRASREELFRLKVSEGEFYLKDLMDKVEKTYADKCASRLITLVIGDYENHLLQGDLDRTREVFDNLFENAFKYGDGRRIEITFYEEDYCQLVRVFNTGEPVSENEFNHIFESFFRGSNGAGKKGSGLGLYICKEIMCKMKGEIFAEMEEEGMAFFLVFR